MAFHPSPQPVAGNTEGCDANGARAGAGPSAPAPAAAAEVVPDNDAFSDLVCVASDLLDVPIAQIALSDGDHSRIIAQRGNGPALLPDGKALWHAIGPGLPVLVVPDARADARFCDDPAVACPGGMRFLLGVALRGASGAHLGVFYVADPLPRAAVSDTTLEILHRLARIAACLIERRPGPHANSRNVEQTNRAEFSAVVVVNADRAIIFANATAQALFGAAVESGQPVASLFPAELQPDTDAIVAWLERSTPDAIATDAASRELYVHPPGGELRKLEAVRCAWSMGADPRSAASGSDAVFALILRDITERRQQPQRRRLTDQQDPLTGLPNRATLLATVDALRGQDTRLGVALLGLNNFRAINNTLGHAIGDAVLQVVACRLLARLPTNAHLARFDGDEFVLVFANTPVDEIVALLDRMLRELARPCEVNHQRVHLEASIGFAMSGEGDDGNGEHCTADCEDADELLARASLAMQVAKRAAGHQLRQFRPDMRAAAIDRRMLDLELRRACQQGEFELHYQPQINLATGLPTGAEALLRWRHPERGLLLPIDFIDALASSGVALAVGRWILQTACRDAALWPDVAGRRLAVGVNLFPVQFNDEHLLEEVDQALAMSGLQAEQLELELTETTALLDDGMANNILSQLRARGIRVAYDDFGTGFASLSMLQRLPVDRVKIDRSFIRNVMENRGDEAIVRSIALIARNFDLEVIAEGVETAYQAEFLHDLGCQDVQGWLYSKALAPDAFDHWLAACTRAPAAEVVAEAHG